MNRLAPRSLRNGCAIARQTIPPSRTVWSSPCRQSSSIPTVAQPAFWKSLIPKPLRRDRQAVGVQPAKGSKPKTWNPATFYIVIFLLIGSMAVNSIALKQEFDKATRQADLRIAKLREVIERIQRGETVDVEKELGTGDRVTELQWEEVLREIEQEDAIRSNRKQEKPKSKPGPSVESPQAAKAKPNRPAEFF